MVLLHQEPIGHLADGEDRRRLGRRHREDAGVLALRDEAVDHAFGIARGEDDVGLGGRFHRFDGGEVDDLVAGHDAAECRSRVAGERVGVGGSEVVAHGCPTRVGVLDDRDRSLLPHVVGEAPRRVGVEEVQIAERDTGVLLDALGSLPRPPRVAVHVWGAAPDEATR